MSQADLLLTLVWESETPAGRVRHRDHLFAAAVDLEKDRLPEALKTALATARAGETVTVSVDGLFDGGGIVETGRAAFQGRRADGSAVTPKVGRFYPAPHFSGISGTTAAIRCVGVDGDTLTLDTRHPLADHRLCLSAKVVGSLDRGGAADRPPVDWIGSLKNGPGFKA